MKIMPYLCQAERQVLAKAYVSSLDLTLDAPRHPGLPNEQAPALRVQHDRGVNKNSTAF